MGASAVCPNCNSAIEFRSLPAEKCPVCSAVLPPQLRSVVESTIRREGVRKPTLLVIGMVGSGVVSALATLFLVLAPFDVGNYAINDEPVSGPEFLRRAGLMMFAIAVICGAVSYGLAADRTWTRPLMLMDWRRQSIMRSRVVNHMLAKPLVSVRAPSNRAVRAIHFWSLGGPKI
jgi:hypothetical protein